MGASEVSPFDFHCPEETFGYTHLSAGDLLREDCIFAAMNSFTRVFHPCCIRFICQLFLIATSALVIALSNVFFEDQFAARPTSHLWVFQMKYCTTVSLVAEFSNIEVPQGCPPVVFDGCQERNREGSEYGELINNYIKACYGLLGTETTYGGPLTG